MSVNDDELRLSIGAAVFFEKKLTGRKDAGSKRFCANSVAKTVGVFAHWTGGRGFGKQWPSPSGLFLKGKGRAPKVVNPVPSP